MINRAFCCVAILVVLQSCGEKQGGSNALSDSTGAHGSIEESDTPEKICVSTETSDQLKRVIFSNAREQTSNDPTLFNDLERLTKIRLEMPLLQSNDIVLKRVECKARVVLDLPVGVREAFGRVSFVRADVDYSVQPAADAKGNVYEISGGEALIQQLATTDISGWVTSGSPKVYDNGPADAHAAATVATAPVMSNEASTAGPSYRTSYDCAKAAIYAEVAVCKSDELATLDLQLAARYKSVREDFAGATDYNALVESQRAWIRERNACSTEQCLLGSYVKRLEVLTSL